MCVCVCVDRVLFGHPPFVHLDREVHGGSWRLDLATHSFGALACVKGALAFWWWPPCVHLVGEVRGGPVSHSLGPSVLFSVSW